MQKQIRRWRKELILAETGAVSDNGKLNTKIGRFLKNIE